MGYRKCMECKGKGYLFIEIENVYVLLEKATPFTFLRRGKPTQLCKKCRGFGYFGPSYK